MTIDRKKMAELEGVAETDLDGDFILEPVEPPAVLPARARPKPRSTEPVRVAPGITLHPGGGLVIEHTSAQQVDGGTVRSAFDGGRGASPSRRVGL
jgi:hypothetical protein